MGIAGNEFITGSLSGIDQLVNLEELYIGETEMDGPLPDEMGKLAKLKVVESSGTAFTGVIPSSFGNLVDLEVLDLSLNQLSGELPEEIGQLTKLESIALYGNGEQHFFVLAEWCLPNTSSNKYHFHWTQISMVPSPTR